jgi:hypothetical protein
LARPSRGGSGDPVVDPSGLPNEIVLDRGLDRRLIRDKQRPLDVLDRQVEPREEVQDPGWEVGVEPLAREGVDALGTPQHVQGIIEVAESVAREDPVGIPGGHNDPFAVACGPLQGRGHGG